MGELPRHVAGPLCSPVVPLSVLDGSGGFLKPPEYLLGGHLVPAASRCRLGRGEPGKPPGTDHTAEDRDSRGAMAGGKPGSGVPPARFPHPRPQAPPPPPDPCP